MKKLIQRLKTRSTLLVLLACVLVVVISVGGTIAYFSGGDEVKNTLSIGKVEISLDEPGWEPEKGLEMRPGGRADKDPTVTAVDGDSYMRIKMEIVDGEGNLLTDEDRLALILQTLWYDKDNYLPDGEKYTQAELQQMVEDSKIDVEFNKEQFAFAGTQEGKPAVRYYHYIANGGIFSKENGAAILFTDMVIPTDWHNEKLFALSGDSYTVSENGVVEITQKGTGYKIILSAEAIQAAEMESAEEAFAALDDATGIIRDTSGIGQEG